MNLFCKEIELENLRLDNGHDEFQSRLKKVFGEGYKHIGIFNKNDEIIARFNIFIGRKLNQNYAITPPYSTSIDLVKTQEIDDSKTISKITLNKNIHRAITSYLEDLKVLFIELVFPSNQLDLSEYYHKGFQSSIKYTYQIDLIKDEGQLLMEMSAERRKNIRDAQKDEIYSIVSNNLNQTSKRLILSLKDNNAKFNEMVVENLVKEFGNSDNGFCLETKMDKDILATHFFFIKNNICYYLFGWSDKSKSSKAGTLGLWSGIKESKRRGCIFFDFAGSQIPSIEKYFRGFGGDLVAMHTIRKESLKYKTFIKPFL